MKVVINRQYGGFGISVAAAKFMAERGHLQAQETVKDWERRNAKVQYFKEHGTWPKHLAGEHEESENQFLAIDAHFRATASFYMFDVERNDPHLVAAVEALGKEAFGEHSTLKIVDIPDGVEFDIHEYDGMEHIAEKHRTWS